MSARRSRGPLATACVGLALALGACGGSSSGSGPAASAAAVPPAPTSGCGSYPVVSPKDPDGVLASLPARYKAAYSGYPSPILKSHWSDWKPPHPPPYTVGIQWAAITSDFQRNATTELQALLKKSPLVGKVIFQSAGNNADVAQEIAQTNQLIDKKPDVVILEALTADSFVPQINRLASLGIPTVMAMDAPTAGNPNSVNVQPNFYAGLTRATAYLMRLIKGKGNVMYVHGLATTGLDAQSYKGFKDTVKRCPNVKVVGNVYTDFTVSSAKSELLKFLATHPQPLTAIAETVGVSPGTLSALQQTGRPIPPVMSNGAMAGFLSYWKEHKSSYSTVGAGWAGDGVAEATAAVTLRMLGGQGIKVTDVTNAPPLITNANLDEWAPKSPAPLFTGAEAGTPANSLASPDYLDHLFNHPAPRPTG